MSDDEEDVVVSSDEDKDDDDAEEEPVSRSRPKRARAGRGGGGNDSDEDLDEDLDSDVDGDASEDDDSDSDDSRKKKKKTKGKPKAKGGRGKQTGKGAGKRASKRSRRSKYIQDTVEVAEDDEEGGLAEELGINAQREAAEARKLEREQQKRAAQQQAYPARMAQAPDFLKANTIEEGAAMVQERYTHERDELIDGGLIQFAQVAQDPAQGDPFLWMVKCRDGHEQEVVIALMNKSIAMAQNGTPLQICSVVYGVTKGTIFVEAHKEAQVKTAVEGIRDLYGGRAGSITPLPKEQTRAVISVKADAVIVKEKSWARVKSGVYKGDLVLVVAVDENSALCKLIPRLDMRRLAMTPEERKNSKGGGRPPPAYFDEAAVDSILRDQGGQLERRTSKIPEIVDSDDAGKAVWFNGAWFHNGFMFKNIQLRSLLTDSIQPTLEELQKFRRRSANALPDEPDDGKDGADDFLPEVTGETKAVAPLARGDRVVVVKGDLTNLQGWVTSIDASSDKFLFKPDEAKFDGLIEMQTSEVIKLFVVGDHVKIINGQYTGETGTVLHCGRQAGKVLVTVFLDTGSKDVEVFSEDAEKSIEVSTGVLSLDGYEMFDLVELSGNKVGIITAVLRDSVQVLSADGMTSTVSRQELQAKRNRTSDNAAVVDSKNQPVKINDTVKVIQGPHAGQNARVKRIHHSTLFLHSTAVEGNSGVFVARSRNVLQTAKPTAPGSKAVVPSHVPVPVGGARGGHAGRGGRGGGRGGSAPALLGKDVIISKGRWSGMLGRVRDVVGEIATVEVSAKQRNFTVPVADCHVLDRAAGHNASQMRSDNFNSFNGVGAATPMVGAATPMIGSATPMLGSATPLLGSATPLLGSATPMLGSATPMIGGQLGAQTPMLGAQTPLLGGATPMLGSRTPMVRSGMPEDPAFRPSSHVPTTPYGAPATPRNQDMLSPMGAVPRTPAVAMTMTGTPMAEPATPGMGLSAPGRGDADGGDGAGSIAWEPMDGVTFTDEDRRTVNGWVVSVADTGVTVETDDRRTMTVQPNRLAPRIPQQGSRVRIVAGQYTGDYARVFMLNADKISVKLDVSMAIRSMPLMAVVLTKKPAVSAAPTA